MAHFVHEHGEQVDASGNQIQISATDAGQAWFIDPNPLTDGNFAAPGQPERVQRTFIVDVTEVNDAPTMAAIASPMALVVGSPQQAVGLTGVSAGPSEDVQQLRLTAVSSNPGLIPNPEVTFVAGESTASLRYTPVAGMAGTALVTVTVSDDGGTANGGIDSAEQSFLVSVSETIPFELVIADGDKSVTLNTATIPGKWYQIRYSPDLIDWSVAIRIQATGNSFQWTDLGPPATTEHPSEVDRRFYVIEKIPPPR